MSSYPVSEYPAEVESEETQSTIFCKHGHDITDEASRASNRQCRICHRNTDKWWHRGDKGRQSRQKYESTERRQYRKYRTYIKRNIDRKTSRLAELEARFYEEEDAY